MIVRTPPARKRRAAESPGEASALPLVIYEDPSASPDSSPPSSQQPPSSPMLCTYQCRQMVKSEFFDALSSAEKQAHYYKARLEELNEQLCKKEAEKNKFKDQLYFSEQELAAAKAHEKVLQEQLLKEVADSQERHKALLQRSSELEVKLKKELDVRKSAENAAGSASEKVKMLEESLRKTSENAERDKGHLRNELLQFQTESSLSLSKLKADLERMECRANNAESESEMLKKQLEELRGQFNESLEKRSEIRQELASWVPPSQESSSTDTDVLVKHLREELRNYEAEVQEARKLKSSHVNNALMKEKLLEEQRRREVAEEQLLKFQAIQVDAQKVEDELILWRSILLDIPDITCRDDIPKKFASLRKEVIECMLNASQVGARVKELEMALEATDLYKIQFEREARLASEKVEKLVLEVRKVESMLSTVTEERDRLRKQNIAWKRGGGENETGGDEAVIKELEASLSEKDLSLRELEQNVNEQRELIKRQCHEIELLNEKLNGEAKKAKSLEREGDRLRAEISLLESKLGHGDYSAASTKVLRMVNTLTVDSEAKHTIEVLQTELQKARSKLQAVEDLKGQSDAGNISEKLAQLKAQVATLEKREERYRSVFAEKISVFRRACCSLFGYKIVMDDHQRPNGIPVTRFTLQSIYANTDEEKLEFEYESGNTNILANDYTMQPEISQQVDIFVCRMKSIPAFTANLTVESFNRRTLS